MARHHDVLRGSVNQDKGMLTNEIDLSGLTTHNTGLGLFNSRPSSLFSLIGGYRTGGEGGGKREKYSHRCEEGELVWYIYLSIDSSNHLVYILFLWRVGM